MRWLLMFLLISGQAQALSCKRPNPAAEFNRYAEAREIYSIAVGTLRITGEIPPYREGEPRNVAGTAGLRFMTSDGLGEPFEQPVELRSTCAGPWCGGFPQSRSSDVYIMFLRHESRARVLDLTPCPSAIQRRSDAVLKLYQTCLRRGRCTNAEVESFEIY